MTDPPAATPSEQADRDTIHARSRSCLASMNAGDIDAVMEHYTDDAVLLFGGVPVLRGPVDVRSHWESVYDPARTADLDTLEINVHGDLAYEIGLYRVESPDGTVTTGKNVVVWRRCDDGVWRLAVDICGNDPAEG